MQYQKHTPLFFFTSNQRNKEPAIQFHTILKKKWNESNEISFEKNKPRKKESSNCTLLPFPLTLLSKVFFSSKELNQKSIYFRFHLLSHPLTHKKKYKKITKTKKTSHQKMKLKMYSNKTFLLQFLKYFNGIQLVCFIHSFIHSFFSSRKFSILATFQHSQLTTKVLKILLTLFLSDPFPWKCSVAKKE